MQLRKITSLTIFFAFICLIFTSLVLFFTPQGRIANWWEWRFMGLTKDDWSGLHINLGWLFAIGSVIHIILNWGAIVRYLKQKRTQLFGGWANTTISAVIAVIVLAGTMLELPPMSWLLEWNQHLKDRAVETYGEPPYGHAEISTLETFAKKLNLDLEKSVTLLHQAGLSGADPEKTLLEIAGMNDISPQQVYEIIQPAEITRVEPGLPEEIPAGTGRKSLEDICAEYGLDLDDAVAVLTKAGYKVTPASTAKEIAEASERHPDDILELLRQVKLKSPDK